MVNPGDQAVGRRAKYKSSGLQWLDRPTPPPPLRDLYLSLGDARGSTRGECRGGLFELAAATWGDRMRCVSWISSSCATTTGVPGVSPPVIASQPALLLLSGLLIDEDPAGYTAWLRAESALVGLSSTSADHEPSESDAQTNTYFRTRNDRSMAHY